MPSDVSIGRAAEATGVKVPTIRYYESVGLLPRPPRTESNRRLYGEPDLARLRFIRHARELGFEIEAIKAMLDLQARPELPCAEIDALARTHLADVTRRISSLDGLKRELERMINSCRRGRVADCRIIETLQHHELCRHHRPTPDARRRPTKRRDQRQ